MGIVSAIGTALQIIWAVLNMWLDHKKERREEKRKLVEKLDKEIPNAIKNKDASALNALIFDINSL